MFALFFAQSAMTSCASLAPDTETRKLLKRLLGRGDQVSIQHGRLAIVSVSGKPAPPDWLRRHEKAMICEILRALGIEGYYYLNYSTGSYSIGRNGGKAPGVTLQFSEIVTSESAYVIFNAELRYVRGVKKGKDLPTGQFRVKPASNFVKFWRRCGLNVPDRLGKYGEYMGNLRGIAFSGGVRNERIDTISLAPINVPHQRVAHAILADTIRTKHGHRADTIRTTNTDSDCPQCRDTKGFQAEYATGINRYGNKVVRDMVNRNSSNCFVNPQSQSVEEWLQDYGE